MKKKITRSIALMLLIYIIGAPLAATVDIVKPEIETSILEVKQEPIYYNSYNVEELVEDEVELVYEEYGVPSNSGFKSYMPYTAITSTSSYQYILQTERAYTGDYGIRQIDGRYCVAVGSYFTTEMGTIIDLVLENGTIIPCIVADQKDDSHTDSSNIFTTANGCMSEFIVDSSALDPVARYTGNISYCKEEWNSPVVSVRVY